MWDVGGSRRSFYLSIYLSLCSSRHDEFLSISRACVRAVSVGRSVGRSFHILEGTVCASYLSCVQCMCRSEVHMCTWVGVEAYSQAIYQGPRLFWPPCCCPRVCHRPAALQVGERCGWRPGSSCAIYSFRTACLSHLLCPVSSNGPFMSSMGLDAMLDGCSYGHVFAFNCDVFFASFDGSIMLQPRVPSYGWHRWLEGFPGCVEQRMFGTPSCRESHLWEEGVREVCSFSSHWLRLGCVFVCGESDVRRALEGEQTRRSSKTRHVSSHSCPSVQCLAIEARTRDLDCSHEYQTVHLRLS